MSSYGSFSCAAQKNSKMPSSGKLGDSTAAKLGNLLQHAIFGLARLSPWRLSTTYEQMM
jgi:hypothetical protein